MQSSTKFAANSRKTFSSDLFPRLVGTMMNNPFNASSLNRESAMPRKSKQFAPYAKCKPCHD